MLFQVFSNGIFSLNEYRFDDFTNYNSIKLVKSCKYSFERNDISLEDIIKLSNTISIVDEPHIPFPQADSFDRVINLCEILYENEDYSMSKDDITLTYDFDKRQTDYYGNAGNYLGLISSGRNANDDNCFILESKAIKLLQMGYNERQLNYILLILSHQVFNVVLSLYLQKGEEPSRSEVIEIMKKCDLYKIQSETTFHRRASTVLSWVRWILDSISE